VIRIELTDGHGDRDGAGGRPYLRDGLWPTCSFQRVVQDDGSPGKCRRFGQPLTHFFRFDVREEWGTPFPAGSHFTLFQCVACADAFIPNGPKPHTLPAKFWEQDDNNHGWWYAALEPPGAPLVRAESAEPLLVPRALSFSVDGKARGDGRYVCACGASMETLLRLPENFAFKTTPGAPEQRGTYSDTEYLLFLGNPLSMFACPKGCDPRAVVPGH
jgi:hypothetical protein